MTYQFTDTATPVLPTTILPASGDVDLVHGSPQSNFLSTAFSGSTVSVTIAPPSGWTLTSVSWSTGGTGTFPVPRPGGEDTYEFNYTVSQNGSSKTNTGVFKIKRAGTGS
jgi:hypothetical protein